jgi:hypothetical protein
MANIIDALVVTLGLDNTQFKKGIKDSDKIQDEHEHRTKLIEKQRLEAERKTEREHQVQHKEVLHRNKEVLEGFTKLRNETIALLTIFTAGKGIIDFVSSTIQTTAALGHLSDNVGMSVGELAGFDYAMKEIGGTAEGANAAIDKAATAVGAFRTGIPNKDVQGLFTAAGGTGINLTGAFKDTKSFMLAQADVTAALYRRDPVTAMLKARQMMGLDTETFNLYKEGRGHLLERMTLGEHLSGITRKQADAAIRAEREWTAIQTRLERVGRTILFALMPSFDKLSHWIDLHSKDISKWTEEFATGITNISPDALDTVYASLVLVGKALQFIHDLGAGLGITAAQISMGENPLAAQPYSTAFDAASRGNWESNSTLTTTTTKSTNTFNIIGNPDPYSVVHAIDKWIGHQSNTGQ